jgi:transposase
MFDAATTADLDAIDPAALKAIILAQRETYQAQQATYEAQIAGHTAALDSRASEIERLRLLVEKLQRLLFGTKSEKVLRQIEQLELQLEELQVATAADLHHLAVKSSKPAAAKPFRRPLPEHLPREIRTHMPEHAACPECGGKLRDLGEDAAEMLEYVRASFKVIRHVRPKRSCQACERIVQAPAPTRPIDRGLAGPGLLAHVLVSKYADHQPLYRQSEIYAREGVDLDRSTLAGWVGAASDLLAPLVDAVRKHVLSASKLHQTTHRFRYSLRAWAGRRPADSGPMFETTGLQAIPLHQPYGSPTRPIARASIRSGIFRTSAEHCRRMPMPGSIISTTPDGSAKRHAGRMLSRKSDTAAAIRYALSRWRALTRYLDDGTLEIDNNAAERSTDSIRRSISSTSSNASPTTPSAASRNSCPGTCHSIALRTSPK